MTATTPPGIVTGPRHPRTSCACATEIDTTYLLSRPATVTADAMNNPYPKPAKSLLGTRREENCSSRSYCATQTRGGWRKGCGSGGRLPEVCSPRASEIPGKIPQRCQKDRVYERVPDEPEESTREREWRHKSNPSARPQPSAMPWVPALMRGSAWSPPRHYPLSSTFLLVSCAASLSEMAAAAAPDVPYVQCPPAYFHQSLPY